MSNRIITKPISASLHRSLTLIIFLVAIGWAIPATIGAQSKSATKTPVPEKPFNGREMSILIGSVTLTDAYKNLLNDFQNETGIVVDLQVVPGDAAQYAQLVQSKIATKVYPDVLVYTSGPSYLNSLMPSENVVEITDAKILEKLKDGVTKLGGSRDGKVYGIPFGGIDFTGLLCNMDVFKQLNLTPPANFEQLVSVCKAIQASGKGIVPIYEMAKQGGPLSAFIYTDIAKNYSDDLGIMQKINTGKLRFENTFILDSLKRKMQLQDQGFFNTDMMSGVWDTMFASLSSNKMAMTFMYSNVLPALYKNYPAANVKMVPLNGVAASTFTQAIYMMKTKNQDLSLEFLKYFTKDTTLNKLYGTLKAVPPYLGVENQIDPALLPMYAQLNAGKRAPVFFDQLIVSAGQVPVLQEMHSGQITPLKACVTLSDKFQRLGREMKMPGFND